MKGDDFYSHRDYSEILKAIRDVAASANMTLRKLKRIMRDEYGFDIDQYEDMIKIAWNYEEINAETFSQIDAIRWIKANIDREKHSGACLFIAEKSPILTMHLFFIDKSDNPLLDASDKHLEIHCKEMDESLAKQFGDKDTIVFK